MSQKTDKMLKLALVFFISLLSFSIGTFVGKKYSDNQHKLAQLEPKKAADGSAHGFASTEAEDKADEASAKADPLLTDTEVAKIAEEFATDDTEMNAMEKSIPVSEPEEKDIQVVAGTVKANSRTAVAAPQKAKPVTAAPVAAAAPNPAPKKEVAATKMVEPAREVASVPANAGQYTVQVGSFPTQAEAQKLTQDLMNKGYKSSFVAAQVNNQTWHRVHVGLFGTVKEAQDYKKDFLEKTKLTSAIVQRVK